MKYLIIPAILLLSLGCNQSAQKQPFKRSDSVKTVQATATNTEYLPWDSVKLNGTVPVISVFKNTEAALGKADSVVTPNYSEISSSFFENERYKYYYFKGVEFERSSDSLVLRSIDFTKDNNSYLQKGQIRFNGSTTLDEFKKLFPKTAGHISTDSDIKNNRVIGLAMSDKDIDSKWLFFFKASDNKLLRIEYWIPD